MSLGPAHQVAVLVPGDAAPGPVGLEQSRQLHGRRGRRGEEGAEEQQAVLVGQDSRVLEIGTGWGTLALEAARRGAVVTSVTLSREQAALARRRVARPLAFLGERSLEIFLAHIVLTDIARHALTVVDVTDVTTHVVVGSIAGVLGPLALWWLGRRAHLPWLFALPHPLRPATRWSERQRAGRKPAQR